MKVFLKIFVDNKYENEELKPAPRNHAFYPKKKTIRNHIHKFVKKNKLDHMDQPNLQLLIQKWKNEDQNRKFLFRPYEKADNENNKEGKYTSSFKG